MSQQFVAFWMQQFLPQEANMRNREQNSKLNVNFILLKCLSLWMKQLGCDRRDAMQKFGYSLKGTYYVMDYTLSTVRVLWCMQDYVSIMSLPLCFVLRMSSRALVFLVYNKMVPWVFLRSATIRLNKSQDTTTGDEDG